MPALFQDLRYALRQLRRMPGFAVTVIATLALGIGAATVVYSIVDAVLLRPLPFPRPDRLVDIENVETVAGGGVRINETSYPNFFDWRSQNQELRSHSRATRQRDLPSRGVGDGPATRGTGVMVSSNLFSTLGIAPVLGRDFRREDERAGNRSVIIGYGLWQTRFGGRPDVLGQNIRLDEETYTVAGVMPKGFVYPLNAPDAQVWVTLAHDAEGSEPSTTQRGYNQLDVVGRLRDGVSLQQARAEMMVLQRALAARYPDDDKEMLAVQLTPAAESLVGDVRQPLRILSAAVGLLLLIACANAAGLLLTRASRRATELSVRAALGASRIRLLRQLMVEALALSLCGGVLGTLLAAALVKVVPSFLPAALVRAQAIAVDGPVLLFALAASAATGMLFGVVPAWRMSRLAPATALRQSARTVTSGRRQHLLHSSLVIGETALGLILLAGAGLLLRSFERIMNTDPGFDPSHLLTFRIATPDARYTDERRVAFFNELLARLKAQPGVKAATAAFPLPLTGGNIRISFSIAGKPVAAGDEPSERVSLVAPEFFQTLRIPLRRGRFFSPQEHDRRSPAVVMVNEAFARKYFAGEDPIGQHMRSGLGEGTTPPMREVVGVVGDVKRATLTESAQPEYYIPIEQAPVAPPAVALRVDGSPAAYENMVCRRLPRWTAAFPYTGCIPIAMNLRALRRSRGFKPSC